MPWRIERRTVLRGAFAATASPGLACSAYPAESGPAYAPWDFPDERLDPQLRLVHAAILAASPHNTQPWLFRVRDDAIELWLDEDHTLHEMDPARRETYIGLGCAVANMLIAAKVEGFETSIEALPMPDVPQFVARLWLQPTKAYDDPLHDVIGTRHTNRGRYGDFALPDGVATSMEAIVSRVTNVELILLRDGDAMGTFARETVAATQAIIDDAEMYADSDSWYRHSREEIDEHRDGVTLDASGLGAGTRFFGKASDRPSASRSARYWLAATEDRQTTGSAFGILTTPDLGDLRQALEVGLAWQRLHLWLQSEGLAAQPLNQLAERRDRELQRRLSPRFGTVLAAWTGAAHAQMLFRVGFAWDDPLRSPRRPIGWVTEDAR